MNKTEFDFDVAIVGAGPAGSLSAHLLAQAGYSVIVLEAAEEIPEKVCGEYLAPSGTDLMTRLGLEALLSENFPKLSGMKLVFPAGREVVTTFPAKNGIPSPGYSLNRKRFDELLASLAQESGAHFRFGFRVKQLKYSDRVWHLSDSTGASLSARILIGADGRRSIVARQLGLTRPVKTSRVALHGFLPATTKEPRRGEMHIFPDASYVGLNPVSESLVNFAIVCNAETIKNHGGPFNVLNHYFRQSPALMRKFGELPPSVEIRSTYPIRHDVLECVADQMALVGDAGGFLDPLTGEGINNALWMASELSSHLAAAKASGGGEEALQKGLRAYALAKRQHFRQKSNLNRIFQFIIRAPFLAEASGKFLGKHQERADTFIGVIGNVYTPLKGLRLMLHTLLPGHH